MIVVEGTFWPLVVVGAIPDSDGAIDVTVPVDEERLWSTKALRLALVVAGTGIRAGAAHEEIFKWLRRHKATLWPRAFRVAWIVEDDTIRACAEAWLALVDERLFGGETSAFRTIGPALSWLLDDSRERDIPGVRVVEGSALKV